MGRGNAIITDDMGNDVDVFYIDYYEHDEEINEETGQPYCYGNPCSCNDFFIDDLLGNIKCSITPMIKGMSHSYKKTYNMDFDNVFETNYMVVKLVDNESSIGIGCCPKYNDNNKIENTLVYRKQANKFMKELNKIYKLRYRTCAWRSSKVNDNETKFY